MKQFFLICTLIFCVFFTNAQNGDNAKATNLVMKNSEALGLSTEQLANFKVSSSYFSESAGTEMVYLLQTYKGLPVYNQMMVLAFKNEKVVSQAGIFIKGMDAATNQQSASPSLPATNAIMSAFTATRISLPTSLSIQNSNTNGTKLDFGKLDNVLENVTAELMWVPVHKGNQSSVKLAWQVQVVPVDKTDWWYIQIDATSGQVIDKINLTVYEGRGQKSEDHFSLMRPAEPLTATQNNKLPLTLALPPTVTSASYRVMPFPVESPNFGAPAIVNSPWLLSGAGNNAVTNGWHFDGTTNYNITRGNNTFAYLDVTPNNTPDPVNNWPDTSTTPIPSLTFTTAPVFTQEPTVNANKKFAITNLFYWNNLMHDVFYQYGYNETAGNFQTDNLGRGGAGNDYVQAQAQDGAGTNNANFSTPPDGSRPRMRMYLWSPGQSTVQVNSPATIAGDYGAVESGFSTNNKLSALGPITGDVAYFNDAAGGTHEACTGAPLNSITGKIALINRGNCSFVIKALAAQAAGAIAIIMVNNVPGAPIIMGGTDNTIIIPAVMVSDVDGAIIAAQLGVGVNATLSGGVGIDGDIDNGIICHEFGHGISNRLTGGPANTSCLQNAEQAGEGWSDYVGLMMTTNWATATLSDGPLSRPIGTYAFGQPGTGAGIRNYPYSTNLTVNPLTYGSLGVAPIGTEVHNVGEVWCMALWEMTWTLIQQQGTINANLFDAAGTGGNSVAMKLVVEGMKLQPCSPGFIDSRNAILTADQNLYGGSHVCAIWAAFAKRGMGYSALQGSSFSASDQTAASDLPPVPTVTAQPANATACAGSNVTFNVTATGYLPTYQWQVSTNGGASWANIVPAVTTASLTLTGVTGTMNNNQYRVVVTGGCPSTPVNSNAAILTVNTANPTITSQPANTSACVGSTATFTVSVSGTNTYNWQVSTDNGATWNNVVPAATTTTLSLTNVTSAMNNNQYRVQVTGGCPSTTITSTAGVLTVTTGSISITTNPVNTSACAGNTATFSVNATGTGLTYNWQVSTDGGVTWNNLVPPVTTATLTLTGVTAGMNNNQYRVIVNGVGACTPAGITSTAATLTISSAASITAQPVNAASCSGTNAVFSVTATGSGLTYQWQVSIDGGTSYTNIPGEVSATLTLTAVTSGMNNNRYRVIVSNSCPPAVTSTGAVLTVSNSASISAQPVSTTVCAGSNATFSATASGASYQWQVSTDGGVTFTDISGAVTTTLNLTAVTSSMNNNKYRLVVLSCNPGGLNSDVVTLTVNSGATINGQPASIAACTGTNAVFTATATGTSLTYQWQISTDGGITFTNITGETAATLTLTGVTSSLNNNIYRVILTTAAPCAAVTSAGATLTVNDLPTVGSSASPSASVCAGSSLTLTGSGASTYAWTNGVTNGTAFTPTASTTYTVTGTDNNGCTNTSTIDVTVLPLPVVAITAPYTGLYPGLTTTITATSTPAGTLFSWYKDAVLIPGSVTNAITVNSTGLGSYYATFTDANGCTGRSNNLTIGDSVLNLAFIYPNPNLGQFIVSVYVSNPSGQTRYLTLYDSKGARVYSKAHVITTSNQKMEVDIRHLSSGVYMVALYDATGKRIAKGKVTVL